MAEGTAALFINFRTGQPTTVVTGIGTASITNDQLAGPVVTTSFSIGTASVTNAQLAGPIVAIIGTSSISNSQIDNTPVVIASGSLSGSTQIDITDIPQNFTQLILEFISVSYTTASASMRTQLSIDNGVSFDNVTANYSLFSLSGTISSPSIIVPFSLTTAGDTYDFAISIIGYQSSMYPRSDGHFKIAGVGSNMSWGLYVGSSSAVNAIRVTMATASFDAGTYRLTGIY